ncbi:hypothetical protein AA11825_1505 [Acetobacter pomorum DSM 11825]|nr:hypothetical protein AA11825_1505 [Acetobacter pomorum DSM 11825]
MPLYKHVRFRPNGAMEWRDSQRDRKGKKSLSIPLQRLAQPKVVNLRLKLPYLLLKVLAPQGIVNACASG